MLEKEAELLGMHAGDGTLYKTNSNTIVWEMRGSIYEQDYYSYVSKLLLDLFDIEVTPKYRGPNSYGIQTCKKPIIKFFLDNGFKPGSKVYTVSIPRCIKEDSVKIKREFIRGLFDTDGCVIFEKNRTPFHYYPRIEFGFASKSLSRDLFDLFIELNFRPHQWKNVRKDGIDFRVALAGFKNLDKWINEIGSSNLKHINRMKEGLLNKSKIKLKKPSANL